MKSIEFHENPMKSSENIAKITNFHQKNVKNLTGGGTRYNSYIIERKRRKNDANYH